MPLEGQSTLLTCQILFLHLPSLLFFFIFILFFFWKTVSLLCLILKLTQVFSLGVSSYPRLENIGTRHSAWVTSVADKALFYFYHRLLPLSLYIIACCSVAFDLTYSSANNFYLICFLQFCERNFHKM